MCSFLSTLDNSRRVTLLKFSFVGKLSTASPETEEKSAAAANLVSMNDVFTNILDLMVQHMVYAINIILARHKKKNRPSITEK